MVSQPLVDPRRYQPLLPVPDGFDKARILDVLASVSVDKSRRGELVAYATADCERFLYTLGLVPADRGGRLLEIGANPYFTTLLLRRFRPAMELSLVNYFGGEPYRGKQTITFSGFDGSDESFVAEFDNVNIETSELPYPDAHFDHVLFCEVLEHMTNDPLRAVLELKRVMKPGGVMVLTTPNAARLENAVAFLEGRNIYDPFSAYGPYGRHNREYTRHELHQLMAHAGFTAESSFTGNVHDDIPLQVLDAATVNGAIARVPLREHDLGQYLFTRWRNEGPANPRLPSWLYRSYAPERMD